MSPSSPAERPAAAEVIALDTPNLGDRSYVVGVDGLAVVVDPQRDTDRVLDLVADRGWRITHVLETHVHNDYVTGGLELARTTGAVYVMPGAAAFDFDATRMNDGETFPSGRATWRALHTPGHTPHHLSYALAVDGVDVGVFTGGSMLHGSVGRPDLLGPALTDGLAHDQWHSVRRIAAEVDGSAGVFPTHGFGSFCAVTATTGTDSTVDDQAAGNPACTLDEDEFVTELLAGLDAFPAYYAHMGPANAAGPGRIDLSLPVPAEAAELRRRIDAGEWVVDLRSRRVFADGHLKGTLSFDGSGNAVTYLGWTIPWGTPLTLLANTAEEVTTMQRELVRIGIDRPASYAVGGPEVWATGPDDLASYPVTDFTGLAKQMAADPRLLVLDTRRHSEWTAGHAVGARHLPLHELLARIDEVKAWSREAAHAGADPRVRVYCGSGFRAAAACSMLERVGVPVEHIDEDAELAPSRGVPWQAEATETTFGKALTA